MRRLLTPVTRTDRIVLDSSLDLHPKVAIRPEPFGALAYHYDTRRLVFLRHPDMVRVVRALRDHPSVAATLTACGIDESRWPSFDRALTSLHESEMLCVVDRSPHDVDEPAAGPSTIDPRTQT